MGSKKASIMIGFLIVLILIVLALGSYFLFFRGDGENSKNEKIEKTSHNFLILKNFGDLNYDLSTYTDGGNEKRIGMDIEVGTYSIGEGIGYGKLIYSEEGEPYHSPLIPISVIITKSTTQNVAPYDENLQYHEFMFKQLVNHYKKGQSFLENENISPNIYEFIHKQDNNNILFWNSDNYLIIINSYVGIEGDASKIINAYAKKYPPEIECKIFLPVTCDDKDGGLNYNQRNFIWSTHHVDDNGLIICLKKSFVAEDSCCTSCDNTEDGNAGEYLKEGYCDEGGIVRFEKYQCPNGCVDGACVQ